MASPSSNSPDEKSGSVPVWPHLFAGATAGAASWGREIESLRAKELSLVTHLLVTVLLFFPIFASVVRGPVKPPEETDLGRVIFPGMPKPRVAQPATDPHGGGGGGAHSLILARQGGLVPFNWTRLVRPQIVRNSNPILAADQSLLGPPEIQVQIASIVGEPLSTVATDSQGSGSDGGFGRGKGGGIGDGNGGGAGKGNKWGYGGGDPVPAGRYGAGYPECVYCPTPSFSEEARKTKTQGAVTLRIVVGTDGRASDLRVVRGLGMGLDERALDAVRGWRFKPALGAGGKPVPTEVLIEVTFRLL